MLILFIVLAIILFVCIIAGIATVVIRAPKGKGEAGENIVAKILGETVEGKQYVINDLLFSDDSGNSCQIDHVFINKCGIWVIETKNYSGNIYGDENKREWTQVLAYGSTKNKFYNPVKQNATHIYRLSNYLKVSGIFQNIVVFLFNADISSVSSDSVYSVKELHAIKKTITGITLSEEQMKNYYYRLLKLKNESDITKEEHIKNIRKMQLNLQRGICPRCGAKLVLRMGRNGWFYGCSSYPNCTFTKNGE